MDIDAAFSSAKIENLVQNMKEHGVANTFVQWTKHLLENRQAFAKLGNNIAEKWIGRGTPQGYLISVILKTIVIRVDIFTGHQMGLQKSHVLPNRRKYLGFEDMEIMLLCE